MIQNENNSSDNELYIGDDLKTSMNNSIFIYHSKEHRPQAVQLSSILTNLTNEQAVLFDDYAAFIATFKEICSLKHLCPIIIESNNMNQTKILTELSSLISIHQIYIFDPHEHMQTTEDDRIVLRKYPKLRDIYFQVGVLVLDWTFERASICEKIGKLCTKNDDPQLARTYYTKAIKLNEKLSATDYASLLILLGPNDILRGFRRPDFCHSRFYILCITPEECEETIKTYANINGEMDIFLPHSAVNIIYTYSSYTNPRRRFHLYCNTEHFVNQHIILQQSKICEQVFHVNLLEITLYHTVHLHLYYCIRDLKKRSDAGDGDAFDLLVPIGELFAQSAANINEIIRQQSGLPEQPTEI
ncbi:hypothetical protein I4U23_004527 [Adineta vaga]|nr:hypothetical protein I4U23_004527 [Adineta vaga]